MFMGSPSGSCLGVSTCSIRTVLITGYHQELQAVPFVEPNHRQECGVHTRIDSPNVVADVTGPFTLFPFSNGRIQNYL
jgi:hypothetical protein